MANAPTPVYAFDPYARNNANLIEGERHTITVKNGYDFHYFIPVFAPFFTKDFKMYTKTQLGAKQYLVEGVDYVFGLRFLTATVNGTAWPLYGSVSFINRRFAGDVYIDYRCLGGVYAIDLSKQAEILADWQHNPIYTAWEQVVDLPETFPPIDHNHDIEHDIYKVDQLIQAIRDLGLTSSQQFQQQIQDMVTAAVGRVSKADIGLGNVQNLPIVPDNRTATDNTNNYYVTPRAVRRIIDAYIRPDLNNHAQQRGNVHGLTLDDIGAAGKAYVDAELAKKLGKTERAASAATFGTRNEQQYKNWVLEGTAANATRYNGLSYGEMVEDVTNRMESLIETNMAGLDALIGEKIRALGGNDAATFGGYTPTTYATFILSKAINAATLDGSTKDQIITEARANMDAATLNGRTAAAIINEARQGVNAVTVGGKSTTQIVNEAVAAAKAAQTPFDYATLPIVQKTAIRQDILGGDDVDADTLGGSTKDQIIAEGRKATTLGGRNLSQVISDAVAAANNRVNAATVGGLNVNDIVQRAVQQAQIAAQENQSLDFIYNGDSIDEFKSTGDIGNISMGVMANGAPSLAVDYGDKQYVIPVTTTVPIVPAANVGTLIANYADGVYLIGAQTATANNTLTTRGFPEAKAGQLLVNAGYYQYHPYRANYFYRGYLNGTTVTWSKVGLDDSIVSKVTALESKVNISGNLTTEFSKYVTTIAYNAGINATNGRVTTLETKAATAERNIATLQTEKQTAAQVTSAIDSKLSTFKPATAGTADTANALSTGATTAVVNAVKTQVTNAMNTTLTATKTMADKAASDLAALTNRVNTLKPASAVSADGLSTTGQQAIITAVKAALTAEWFENGKIKDSLVNLVWR